MLGADMSTELLLSAALLVGVLGAWILVALGLWMLFMRGRRQQHIIESPDGGYELADDPDMRLAPRRWPDE